MFPELLTFGLIAPFVLRIAVSFFILNLGLERRKKNYSWAVLVYVVIAFLLTVGLYTQLSAILGLILVKLDWIVDNKISWPKKDHIILYSLVGAILLSLIFTGPGLFAFDLPL